MMEWVMQVYRAHGYFAEPVQAYLTSAASGVLVAGLVARLLPRR